MNEPLPLGVIHDAELEFLRNRDDAVLFGAQAVYIYVHVPRLTQDVNVASTRGEALAEELCQFLNARFQIAVRVRNIRNGLGFRVYQVRKPDNRHLVDVRPVLELPPSQRESGFLVVTPEELIANKVCAFHARRGHPKAGTDWRDLAMLLLQFPELKKHEGAVRDRLRSANGTPEVMAEWDKLVDQEISAETDEGEFDW